MKAIIRKDVKKYRILSLLLALILVCGIFPQTASSAAERDDSQIAAFDAIPSVPTAAMVKAILDKTAKYQFATVQNPTINKDEGNEWTVFALARGGYITDDYIWKYIGNLTAYVKEAKGVLSTSKYTEYSRVIIALSSIGIDPHDIAGYDLVAPLAEYENVIKQGVNGPAFALIALDTKKYAVPSLPAGSSYTQTTRDNLISFLLSKRCSDRGWNVAGNVNTSADPDMTAMVIQALAPYYDIAHPDVQTAVDGALAYLSSIQNAATAGFGTSGSEADAAVITALNMMGIPIADSRFEKNDKSLYDDLMTYYISDTGAFKHLQTGKANAMATDRAMAALISFHRSLTGAKTLYDMSDVPAYTKPIKFDINEAVVTGISDNVFTGKEIEPEPKVTLGGKTLRKNTDYAVSYEDNKNVGTAKIMISGKGDYFDVKTVTFKITAPKAAKTSIKKLKAGKKSFTLTWKKNSKAKGYEVQYGTDKKFKKSVKSKLIKKNGTVKFIAKKLAAKKTYYVRIRSYVEIGKTKFYSGWSMVKKVKTKA